ncbi:YoaK family protein [Streptococcus loxodontisalivarius]|uniref:Uncharacterized membrane protein YoaK (UPF0700 family) n=1 Tax=Streptococcus loxodontisalivarius TaxID=1349415 RepID=A0ABS2PPI6_9STRE|nr:YoaK family protein [Streptococcus loxodontisalivarius]MBM7641885.1 uncharacterized membrane protein YoaK (UPF0700 family) [Streptococcus loxodontisalivarius]
MTKKKNYRIFEGLRIAVPLTFISGFLNAFTFVTQGGRFAGVQSGNVISWAYYFALKDYRQVINFTVPIAFFALGQIFTYLAKRWFDETHHFWHLGSSLILTLITVIAALITPFVSDFYTNALVAFVASIQVETFQKIHGAPYASVMMTGNVKNAARLYFKGIYEKNKQFREQGRNIFLIIASFATGVYMSTRLSYHFGEYTLWFVIIPLLWVDYLLWLEKKSIN